MFSSALADSFAQMEVRFEELSFEDLRNEWRRRYGRPAPASLSRRLLVRLLLYRAQTAEFGDLDVATAQVLSSAGASAIDLRRNARLSPGTILVREHAGAQHTVTVSAKGFWWQDQEYRSLSQVARAITGTNWNGPRFFGLRESQNV
jgi:hypothetical protein